MKRGDFMECLKCGATVLEENAVFCHECGARLDGKITCPNCGQFVEDKYAYCAFCGTELKANSNTSNDVATLTQQKEQSLTNENGKAENKLLGNSKK